MHTLHPSYLRFIVGTIVPIICIMYRRPSCLEIFVTKIIHSRYSLPRYIIIYYNLIYGRFRFRTPCPEFTTLYSTYCYLFYIRSAPIIIIYNSSQAKSLSFDLSITLPRKKRVLYKKHVLTLSDFLRKVSVSIHLPKSGLCVETNFRQKSWYKIREFAIYK